MHTGRFFALGIALIVFGTIALTMPLLTTIATVVWYGAFVLVAGVFETATVFGARRWSGIVLHLLSGIAGIVLGVLLMARPAAGAAGLTLAVAALFLVAGIARVAMAIVVRFPSWGWALANGVVTALFGAWIAAGWPATSLITIGTLVAIEMIMRGWSWIMLATQMKRVSKAVEAGSPLFSPST
ncbi:MAG TPA: HdeD family acid-resistance protein [Polyangia bacterium]|nr:HdeD family acid-resistance protein [Polyangia bacterium]